MFKAASQRKRTPNSVQLIRFRLHFIQSWRNLRTFQGLPLEFKYFSGLWEPWDLWDHCTSRKHLHKLWKSSNNIPQDFALFFLIDSLLFSFSPGNCKHILHILISICLNYKQSSVRRFFALLLDTTFYKFIKLRTTLLRFIKSWRISTPQGTTSHKTVNFLQWQKQK